VLHVSRASSTAKEREVKVNGALRLLAYFVAYTQCSGDYMSARQHLTFRHEESRSHGDVILRTDADKVATETS
jgi:hypothetical protein